MLSACSSDDGDVADNSGNPAQGGKPFVFKVSQEKLTDPDKPGTRSSIETEATFSQFYMNFFVEGTTAMNFATVTRYAGTNTWRADNQWPSNNSSDKPVLFYAYANVDYTPSEEDKDGLLDFDSPDNPYLYDIEIDEATEHQKDMLVAQTTQTEPSKTTDKVVSLTFSHACAALQFSICKTNSLSAYEIKVNRIILHNIKKKGDYYYNDNTWKNISEEAADKTKFTLKAYNNGSDASETGVLVPLENEAHSNSLLLAPNANDYMFVIPQTVTPWDYASNGAYIEIQCSITKGEKTYDDSGRVYLPFTDTWEKGCIHRYNIRMGTSLRNISGAPIDFSN